MAGLWLCCGLSPVGFSQAINTDRYLVLIWVEFNVLTFPELGFHINLEQRGKLRCFPRLQRRYALWRPSLKRLIPVVSI